MMSSHLALPREGHLRQVLQIFAYLDKYHNVELVFDPSEPVIDHDRWGSYYGIYYTISFVRCSKVSRFSGCRLI